MSHGRHWAWSWKLWNDPGAGGKSFGDPRNIPAAHPPPHSHGKIPPFPGNLQQENLEKAAGKTDPCPHRPRGLLMEPNPFPKSLSQIPFPNPLPKSTSQIPFPTQVWAQQEIFLLSHLFSILGIPGKLGKSTANPAHGSNSSQGNFTGKKGAKEFLKSHKNLPKIPFF